MNLTFPAGDVTSFDTLIVLDALAAYNSKARFPALVYVKEHVTVKADTEVSDVPLTPAHVVLPS